MQRFVCIRTTVLNHYWSTSGRGLGQSEAVILFLVCAIVGVTQVLIGKRGATLDSLQYLVSLVVNKDLNDYVRVKVDTENYRERRKETLENLAKNIAYKVKRTKRPVSLEPMNPYERRIIHYINLLFLNSIHPESFNFHSDSHVKTLFQNQI